MEDGRAQDNNDPQTILRSPVRARQVGFFYSRSSEQVSAKVVDNRLEAGTRSSHRMMTGLWFHHLFLSLLMSLKLPAYPKIYNQTFFHGVIGY